jgi:hypothetical protein
LPLDHVDLFGLLVLPVPFGELPAAQIAGGRLLEL